MMFKSIFALLLSLMLVACGSPTASLEPLPISPSEAEAGYQLGAGDKLRMVVGGFSNLSIQYRVSDVGTISLPMLGAMNVAGKTTTEVEQQVAAALAREELARNPSVNVQVEEYRSFFITGEVRRPGSYPYAPGMTVLSAITVAGGHTFRANTKAYSINRTQNGNVVKGKGTDDTRIAPGDTIVVHESWF